MTQPDKRSWLVRVREAREKFEQHRDSCEECGGSREGWRWCIKGVDLYYAWMHVTK